MDFRERYGPWALVTGASSGIGREFARQLAARGLDLCLVARREERLRTLAEQLGERHRIRTAVLPADLAAPGAAGALHAEVGERAVGLLVNNAGFGHTQPFVDMDPARIAAMLRLHCETPTLLARAFLPAMAERGHGGMIMVSSTAAYQATPYIATYGASKGYALLLGEALAVELRGRGVDVLTVAPGSMDSEFHQVSGTGGPVYGGMADPAGVAARSLQRLPRGGSFVPGWGNRLMAFSPRLAPRGFVARCAGRVLRKRLQR